MACLYLLTDLLTSVLRTFIHGDLLSLFRFRGPETLLESKAQVLLRRVSGKIVTCKPCNKTPDNTRICIFTIQARSDAANRHIWLTIIGASRQTYRLKMLQDVQQYLNKRPQHTLFVAHCPQP